MQSFVKIFKKEKEIDKKKREFEEKIQIKREELIYEYKNILEGEKQIENNPIINETQYNVKIA